MPPRGPGTARGPGSAALGVGLDHFEVERGDLLSTHPPRHTGPFEDPGGGVGTGPDRSRGAVLLWLPCPAPWPLKLCRFMAPAKPLPLETAMASTRSPALIRSAVSCWPTSYPLASSSRSSTRCRPGSTPAALKWPCSGLLSEDARWTPHVTCRAEYPSRSGGLDLHHPQGRDLEHRHRDGAVVLVPDLGHADLLADDRLGRHGGWGPFRPHAGAAANAAARLIRFFGAVTGARFACQRSARETRSGALARFCPEVPT